MNYDELIHRLRGLASAYPEDVFPDFTKQFSAEERSRHGILISLVSASMGRHLGKFIAQAADAIEELQRDARRYRCVRDGFAFEVFDHTNLSDPVVKFGDELDTAIDEAMHD